MMCGGTTPAKLADDEVQQICDSIKSELAGRAGVNFSSLTAHSYKTQVVAGMNYFVKACIGNNKFVHIRIYKNLQGDLEVSKYQLDKTEQDEIDYF